MKITKIEESIPQVTTLPDGIYQGIWGGYMIKVEFNKKMYDLTTEEGIKGIGIRVVVTIRQGEATFDTLKN